MDRWHGSSVLCASMGLGDYLLVSATFRWCTRKEGIPCDSIGHITFFRLDWFCVLQGGWWKWTTWTIYLHHVCAMSESSVALYDIIGHGSPIIDLQCTQWNDSNKMVGPFYSSKCPSFVVLTHGCFCVWTPGAHHPMLHFVM
jgi:hypothetical protein